MYPRGYITGLPDAFFEKVFGCDGVPFQYAQKEQLSESSEDETVKLLSLNLETVVQMLFAQWEEHALPIEQTTSVRQSPGSKRVTLPFHPLKTHSIVLFEHIGKALHHIQRLFQKMRRAGQ